MSEHIIHSLQQQKSVLLSFTYNITNLVLTFIDDLHDKQIHFGEANTSDELQQELAITSSEIRKVHEAAIKISDKMRKTIKIAIHKCTTFKTILTRVTTNILVMDLSQTSTCCIELLSAHETVTTVKNDYIQLHETCCIALNNYKTNMQDNANLAASIFPKDTFA